MASENQMNAGIQQSEKSILCANGCGFFGTASTMNLCSKCYRDHRLKEEQAASAKAAVEKAVSPVTIVVEKKAAVEAEVLAPSSEVEKTAVVKAANRCGSCNKKVGVLGFKCRCGATFCGSHRYPEEHSCAFDFKEVGRDAIAKANPIVKADKLQRF